MDIITIILIICFLALSFSCFMMIRNEQVYKYRIRLLNKISEKTKQDLDRKNWRWRYDELEKISYNEMMYKFWKPLSSFYDEENLLK